MTKTLEPRLRPPQPELTGPLVVALLYDGLCTFEFGLVAEIFGLARPEFGSDWYRFASCPVESGPLRAHGGLTLTPDHDPELIEEADIIVVPGWKGVDCQVPEELNERLRQAHSRGARLVSICSGAFVLAATGLLNGRSATTHWRYADKLREHYPEITVDETSLYRLENRIFTSAGSAAGIDLMIEIIRQDHGPERANSVARRLVVPAHRTGGQAQFLERPVAQREGSEIAPIVERMRADIAAVWTIERMAEAGRMSPRTFQRRFLEATGVTPGDWLVHERLEAAKDILSRGNDDMETIATLVGFGSAHALRHHFRKKLGLRPSQYRAQFGVSAE
ncbi:transcriptional regulator FtrA [Roseibium algicola]|uniref:Transcriptional regulator FtrA n=1 Tax=Roseibium algicola TaxID=2857014 RepID=A0ABM6IAJ8_9HYPH|nr:transcriptional regulator FtrA [Roseibium aggregatum]AQQ07515.1 transcriptional regulator FtrA [Roseibium aggregatum]